MSISFNMNAIINRSIITKEKGAKGTETYMQQCDIYKEIVDVPVGAIFFAGDSYSQTPGWQEGAIASARYAVLALTEGKRSTDPALYGTETVMACPS